MDTNKHELVLKEEVFRIVGCAMEVLNTLGHGLLEKPYENALVVEFGLRSIPFQQQPRFDVIYKSVKVGEYIPDGKGWCFDGTTNEHEYTRIKDMQKKTLVFIGVHSWFVFSDKEC